MQAQEGNIYFTEFAERVEYGNLEFGFQRVLLKQNLDSKGWKFPCPLNLIGGLPGRLTQGLLVGKLLVGGLGVSKKEIKRIINSNKKY